MDEDINDIRERTEAIFEAEWDSWVGRYEAKAINEWLYDKELEARL